WGKAGTFFDGRWRHRWIDANASATRRPAGRLKLNGVPLTRIELVNTHRLIPSRYPSVGLFDLIADPGDIEMIVELEGWTNDRISAELGVFRRIPSTEWVIGRAMASVIMAAFCHPHPQGARFNGTDLGAWYAARSLDTAHAEVTHHRTIELQEI